MSEPNSAEAKAANHFYARGGFVRRASYFRIPPDERFVATDPTLRQRSIDLLRDAAKQLAPRIPNGPHPVVFIGQEREVCICGEPASALTHQAQGIFTVPPELAGPGVAVMDGRHEAPER